MTKLRRANIVHAECPKCGGTGTASEVEAAEFPPLPVDETIKVWSLKGLCVLCKGKGWIHADADSVVTDTTEGGD